MKLRPPHGWAAAGWELAVVTLGVLIALAAQQWADGRDWAGRVKLSRAALRDELAEHYTWSVEWRTVSPCLLRQLDALQRRVLASGAVLQPAPVYSEPTFSYVVRLPSKEYGRSAWDAAVGDGVAQRFDPAFRRELSAHYAQVDDIAAMTRQNNDDYQELFGLSRPIPLDPGARLALLRTLDRLRGRVEFMDLLSGQLIDHVVGVGMVPPATEVRRDVERFGAYQFCKARGLPLRSWAAAMLPIAN